MPSSPEEETDEEKGLRRLFEQLAGAVRNSLWKPPTIIKIIQ